MPTSGDTTWQLQRDQIIAAALRKVGFDESETPNAVQISGASEALNALITSWRADGMPVWAMKTYTFPLQTNKSIYSIGVGEELNTPAPLKMTQAIRISTLGGTRVPLNIYTDYDFKQLSNFTSAMGVPVQIYYQPLAKTGTIKLWPTPDNVTAENYVVEITYQRPFEEFDSATDEPDFPSYWTRALIYGLANDLAPEYGMPLQDRRDLREEARAAKELALEFGTEEGGIFFMPDWSLNMYNK